MLCLSLNALESGCTLPCPASRTGLSKLFMTSYATELTRRGQDLKTEPQAEGASKLPAPTGLWLERSAQEGFRLWSSYQMTRVLLLFSAFGCTLRRLTAGEGIGEMGFRLSLDLLAKY